MNKVLFVGGNYIKPREGAEPEYHAYYKRWYCAGYRWIKSKKKWSSSCLLHNFQSYEWLDEEQLTAVQKVLEA